MPSTRSSTRLLGAGRATSACFLAAATRPRPHAACLPAATDSDRPDGPNYGSKAELKPETGRGKRTGLGVWSEAGTAFHREPGQQSLSDAQWKWTCRAIRCTHAAPSPLCSTPPRLNNPHGRERLSPPAKQPRQGTDRLMGAAGGLRRLSRACQWRVIRTVACTWSVTAGTPTPLGPRTAPAAQCGGGAGGGPRARERTRAARQLSRPNVRPA